MEENLDQTVTEVKPSSELVISEEIKFFLVETAKWGKFLSIVGFVFCGIILLLAIALVFGASIISALKGSFGGVHAGFIAGIYLAMGLMYYFPSKYLYDFSVFIKQALEINDQESLTYAFSRLKSLYRFWGILVAVFLGFYAIVLLFALIALIFAGVR